MDCMGENRFIMYGFENVKVDCEIVEQKGKIKNIDTILWNMWKEHNESMVIVETEEYYVITVSPNSRINLFYSEKYLVDSLLKIPLKKISEQNLVLFLAYGYFPGKETLYHRVWSLESGCYLQVSKKSGYVESVPICLDRIPFDKTELADIISQSCNQIKKKYSSFWLAISGGLDSSVLYNELKEDNPILFNVRAEGGRDETKFIQKLLGEKQKSILCFKMTEQDAWDAFCSHSMEEEIFGFPIILKYEYMFKKLKENGCERLIMGDGPDELFVCKSTYEPYVDHEQAVFLPIHSEVNSKYICSKTFSKCKEKNIWALYNLLFQGSTNVRFLHNLAYKNNIVLNEPYLQLDMLNFCIQHAEMIANQEEKQLLKRYAVGKISDEIISRRKMGYSSDFKLWCNRGGIFFEYIYRKILNQTNPVVLTQYTDYIKDLLVAQSTDYDPMKNTRGIGKESLIFRYMLLLRWLDKHEEVEIVK